jgi:hypothetical protein
MSTKEQIFNEIYDCLKKISTPIIYILIGVGANLTDHYRKGTLNKKQAFISGAMGIVIGYMTWKLCRTLGWESHEGYLIPAATMAGERIVPYLIEFMPKAIKSIFEKKVGEIKDNE